jgi:cold shock protein
MTYLNFLLAVCLIVLISCGRKTDFVESGVYLGTVYEVEADEMQIYVKTEDGKLLELRFTDATSLTRSGVPVDFDHLAEGQKVELELIKEGKRFDPVSVKIME